MSEPIALFQARRVRSDSYRFLIPRAYLRVPAEPDERAEFLRTFLLRRSSDQPRDVTASARRRAQEHLEQAFRKGYAADVEEFFLLDLQIDGAYVSGSVILSSTRFDLQDRAQAEEYVQRANRDAEAGERHTVLELETGGWATATARKSLDEDHGFSTDEEFEAEAMAVLPSEMSAEYARLDADERAHIRVRSKLRCSFTVTVPAPGSTRALVFHLTTVQESAFEPLVRLLLATIGTLELETAQGWCAPE